MDTTDSFHTRILNKRNGFTLVELLVVIAIVGILLTVALASYSTVQKKTRDGRKKQDLLAFQNAFEQFYINNNGSYLVSGGGTSLIPTTVNGVTYMQSVPNDPKGTPYPTPMIPATGSSYCMCVQLESDRGNYTDSACVQPTPGTYYCIKSQQ